MGILLQLALASLVAYWAIQRMVQKQKFNYRFTAVLNFLAVCDYMHSFGDFCAAGDRRFGRKSYFYRSVLVLQQFSGGAVARGHSGINQAHSARTGNLKIWMVAKVRNFNPDASASLKYILPGENIVVCAVYIHVYGLLFHFK